MRPLVAGLAAGILALPIAVSAGLFDFGRTLRVDCSRKGETISRALRRARAGDTILVTGTCIESVPVDKAVTLDGMGEARIHAPSATDVAVRVTSAEQATIRGFTLEAPARIQITVAFGGNARIEGNTLRNATNFGISIGFGSFGTVLGNVVSDNAVGGILALEGGSMQVGANGFFSEVIPNLVENNTSFGVIAIGNSNAVVLGGNRITGSNVGVLVADGAQARVAGNEIFGNNIGILTDRGGVVQLPVTGNPNPLLTALNSGANTQFGIACQGGAIGGVADLQPAVALPAPVGALAGTLPNVTTFCQDSTVPAPVPSSTP